jgi:hypothetical protein
MPPASASDVQTHARLHGTPPAWAAGCPDTRPASRYATGVGRWMSRHTPGFTVRHRRGPLDVQASRYATGVGRWMPRHTPGFTVRHRRGPLDVQTRQASRVRHRRGPLDAQTHARLHGTPPAWAAGCPDTPGLTGTPPAWAAGCADARPASRVRHRRGPLDVQTHARLHGYATGVGRWMSRHTPGPTGMPPAWAAGCADARPASRVRHRRGPLDEQTHAQPHGYATGVGRWMRWNTRSMSRPTPGLLSPATSMTQLSCTRLVGLKGNVTPALWPMLYVP